MQHGQIEVLIKWKDLPEFEAIWESVESIQMQFPSFHLEDLVDFGVAGNGRPPIRFTYVRRGKNEVGAAFENIHQVSEQGKKVK